MLKRWFFRAATKRSSAADTHCITCAGGRRINEDSVATLHEGDRWLFAVADGLGGHGGGEVASDIAVATAKELFLAETAQRPQELLHEIFQTAQARIVAAQEARGDGMKTTLVVLLLDGNTAYYAHVGDTRLYVFRDGAYQMRTMDHSMPQLLVAMGEITEADIRHHEDRNRLLQALGSTGAAPRYDVCADGLALAKGDAFLLCSDGFWEYVEEPEMARMLRGATNAADWLAKMEQTVLKHGNPATMDNYSAIGIRLP